MCSTSELNSDMNSEINSAMNHNLINSDDLSNPSSPDSGSYDDGPEFLGCNDITAQLAAAGTVGIAAAAAIASAKKRKRPHSFETNPSVRRRQQTRLTRKLKATIDEYTIRVGQQAVVLAVTPGKPQNNFKVFGAHPLDTVVRNCKNIIMQELENALAEQAPPQSQDDPQLYDLPPLVIDGIPTPVEKMTQAQLRTFIPLMLKYSTGRGKPGWGRESTKPVWWPKDLPWANVRSDVRSEEEKQKVSWTHALRQIVTNCYKYHGREDLLPVFIEEEEKQPKTLYTQPLTAHYAPTMVQTINNPDGTLSIIHVDPTSTVVTLSDGTQAQVRAVSAVDWQGATRLQGASGESTQTVQTLVDVAAQQEANGQVTPISLDLTGDASGQVQTVTALTEATINQDGQIILTGEDGTQSAFPVAGMVTIPVSMYQTVVTNIAHLADVQSMQVAELRTVASEEASVKSESDSVQCVTITPTDGSDDR